MGRSASNPLPPILNNKFDALPPAEGLVFDFVFDFKARFLSILKKFPVEDRPETEIELGEIEDRIHVILKVYVTGQRTVETLE